MRWWMGGATRCSRARRITSGRWMGTWGSNTGGMGAYSPAPVLTPELERAAREQVLEPFMRGLEAEGIVFKGLLYPGLMVTREGLKVLEFNCRFGDPETQAFLPRLKTDLVEVMEAVIDGRLAECPLEWSDEAAVCVVMASGGYPGEYEKGKEITGNRGGGERGGDGFPRGDEAGGRAGGHGGRAGAGGHGAGGGRAGGAREGVRGGGKDQVRRGALPRGHCGEGAEGVACPVSHEIPGFTCACSGATCCGRDRRRSRPGLWMRCRRMMWRRRSRR